MFVGFGQERAQLRYLMFKIAVLVLEPPDILN